MLNEKHYIHLCLHITCKNLASFLQGFNENKYWSSVIPMGCSNDVEIVLPLVKHVSNCSGVFALEIQHNIVAKVNCMVALAC